MHRLHRFSWLALLLLPAGCASIRVWSSHDEVRQLVEMYERRDYFGLRTALEQQPTLDDARVTLLRAIVAHAFNDPIESNRQLDLLGPGLDGINGSMRAVAHRLRYRNHFRLHEYAAAAAAAEHFFALENLDSLLRAETENELRIARALADVAPQRVVRRTSTSIPRGRYARVPVVIGDSLRSYMFDTGANLSVMRRSEAESLGLEIRHADVEIGTSTGKRFVADVTVAPRLRLGGIEIENVAFLVAPDEVLGRDPQFSIPGILGFPVLDALGEVEFRRNGVMHIPNRVPSYDVHNLALRFLMPVVQLEVLNEQVVCDLDTGATHSALFLRFYERMKTRIQDEGRPDTVRIAGVAGDRLVPAWVLDNVTLTLGETSARLFNMPAYTVAVDSLIERGSDCRLGLDVLSGFNGYIVNLRSMSLLPIAGVGDRRIANEPR
ncbi:MAG TPA: pepsin/retropepsin-like aspartic protease family protein [Longimicrobiales bacterium]|nr:pepsin/retropepsin-like aspartic protease family protein [Longimicrobiales bacterium]